ncbi:DNA-processing protein DprA [Thalassospira sp. TSL5-1]|uniref:DNA-processing protein DprA n=1 Tax=Thalassospira sp. TSL5-1 TaxID=1544451 RepID=UPI00093FA549|nr:DNA-processing protein DprA [Thalassospira sp. TSL5-1]OKH89759.1 DNA-binding protein [Thalassospira sp. TSL5-1]
MRLARSSQIGPVTFRRLLEQFGAARHALDALPDIIAKSRAKRPVQIATREDTIAEIEAAQALSARPIIWGDPEYPPALAAIEDAPPYFYVLGDPAFLNYPTIGIVGARNASLGGCQFAGKLARELALAGYNVASGLARGIDGAAHEGAISALKKQTDTSSSGSNNAGVTIAVVAGGVDVIYPREHADLYRRICENGCVISEMAPGLKPQARHFPRRNRIISGLSQGIVVIEAGRNSGSLITARMAAEQGRDVFAVPGSPTDPRAAGPNSLIRDGAILCDSIDAILDVVGPAQDLRQFDAPIPVFNTDNRPAPGPNGAIDIAAILASMEQDQAKMPDDGENNKTEKPLQSPANAPVLKPEASRGEPARATEEIYELLSSAPMAIDSLIRASNLSAGDVSTLLIELELAGRVERHPGNRVSRIPN